MSRVLMRIGITHPTIALKHINGSPNTRRSSVENMGVNHCRFDAAMAQKFLYSSNLIPAFEQVGGERIEKALGILDETLKKVKNV